MFTSLSKCLIYSIIDAEIWLSFVFFLLYTFSLSFNFLSVYVQPWFPRHPCWGMFRDFTYQNLHACSSNRCVPCTEGWPVQGHFNVTVSAKYLREPHFSSFLYILPFLRGRVEARRNVNCSQRGLTIYMFKLGW